jgi:hypothetical protein
MHMLESSSHQIPLARNLVVGPNSSRSSTRSSPPGGSELDGALSQRVARGPRTTPSWCAAVSASSRGRGFPSSAVAGPSERRFADPHDLYRFTRRR